MANFRLTTDIQNNFPMLSDRIKSALKEAMVDIMMDVNMVAIGSAPHWKGTLERSGIHKDLVDSGSTIGFNIGVSQRGKNGFDYGVLRHDSNYNLGEKSRGKSGGASGIAGTRFPVGQGFISKPMEQNEQAYIEYLQRAYEDTLNGI